MAALPLLSLVAANDLGFHFLGIAGQFFFITLK
jgi:hypothetical protein